MQDTTSRIDRLERLVADLDGRLAAMEGVRREKPVASTPTPAVQPRPAANFRPAPAPPSPVEPYGWARLQAPRLPDRDELEDLVGGRVLAWVGGLAVLLGMVFLFALAISNGWIGEAARVVIGGLGSAGLLALGVWLHETKARTDAALACVATGISGLFVTLTVAAQVYELIPQLSAVVFAMGVGAIATWLAVQWESRGIAALGILGALVAPVLAGVGGNGDTMPVLFVALASAAGALLWLRWDWLALAAFAVATPQWIDHLVDQPPLSGQLAVLVGFGALGVAVAVGHDVRVRAKRLRSSSAYLLALNAIVVSAAGWGSLYFASGEGAANGWLAAMALVHVGVGLAGPRVLRLSKDLRLLALALGAVIGNVAFGLVADGPVLAIGWSIAGVGFAALTRHQRATADPAAGVLAQAGLGGHLGLSLLSAVAISNPVEVLNGSDELTLAGAAAVAALAAGCIVSARIAGERHEAWRIGLDSIGLAAVAILTALSLDGLQLVLAWCLEVVALAALAKRSGDAVAAYGALGFLALAALHALVVEAPPLSLVTGLAEPAAAVAALAAVAACLVLIAGWAEADTPQIRTALRGAAAIVLLYLASTLVVTPFESDSAIDSTLLSAHQQGQMVLSVFWALVGVGTIVVGLRRDLGAVRIAGLALLGVAVTKVFLFDLATLTAGYRVVSLIGLGLLLMGGALVWQRLRPQSLSDLRETPAGVR
jgi:uncharacterized membrane protein